MGKWFGVWSLETIITPLSIIQGEDEDAMNSRTDFISGEDTGESQLSVVDGVFFLFFFHALLSS